MQVATQIGDLGGCCCEAAWLAELKGKRGTEHNKKSEKKVLQLKAVEGDSERGVKIASESWWVGGNKPEAGEEEKVAWSSWALVPVALFGSGGIVLRRVLPDLPHHAAM